MPDEMLPPFTLPGSIWAARLSVVRHLLEVHRATVSTTGLSALAERTAGSAPRAARRGGERAGGAVAILPLTGVITPRGSFLSRLFGGLDGGLLEFREHFRDAVASPDVGAIVLDIDSPGGLHSMVPETGAEILAARGSKPIIAVANGEASSAAYWLAAQCDEIVVTPSGHVGSVGVYRIHEDWSGFNEQAGIVPSYVYAGRYKVEGNMDEPLSDEAREDWQQHVDTLYEEFVAAVAAGRAISTEQVLADYGEGRVLYAPRALEAGMVDRVETFDAVIGELLGSRKPGAGGSQARADRRPAPAPAAESQPNPEPDPDSDAEPAPAPAPEPDPDPEPDPALPTDPQERSAVAGFLIDQLA